MRSFSAYLGSSALSALVVAGTLMTPQVASAGEVTLKAKDGTSNLVGELVGFENNTFVIRTSLGEMRATSDQVTCFGAACPQAAIPVANIVENGDPGADLNFSIVGSDTMGLGLMPLIIDGWAATMEAEVTMTASNDKKTVTTEFVGDLGFGDPMGSVQVAVTSSSDSFRALREGRGELGMSSRRISNREARQLRDTGAGDMFDPAQEHIVAVDSIVVVVHPDNPVKQLDVADVARIYSGQVTNWSQVGGPDAPINVNLFQDGSGTQSVFFNRVFNGNTPRVVQGVVQKTNPEMADAVSADPYAIGFVGYAFRRGARALPLVSECGITMSPDTFSARTEEYALQRRLYLYNTAGGLSPQAQDLIDYAKSAEADDQIEKAGFISLSIARQAQDFNSRRAQSLLQDAGDAFESAKMREMLGSMIGYDRLSSTFRFEMGSSQLDQRALLDMTRLIDYLADMPEGTEVKFVGFTDSVGTFQNNQALSERRSAQVLETLTQLAGGRLSGIEMDAIGFGEIAPSACNVNDDDRQINRRVEVWISSSIDT